MSWLRRHAFNVQDKNSPTESKTIFEITSDKDHLGHYLDILFTYFNDFQDLYYAVAFQSVGGFSFAGLLYT